MARSSRPSPTTPPAQRPQLPLHPAGVLVVAGYALEDGTHVVGRGDVPVRHNRLLRRDVRHLSERGQLLRAASGSVSTAHTATLAPSRHCATASAPSRVRWQALGNGVRRRGPEGLDRKPVSAAQRVRRDGSRNAVPPGPGTPSVCSELRPAREGSTSPTATRARAVSVAVRVRRSAAASTAGTRPAAYARARSTSPSSRWIPTPDARSTSLFSHASITSLHGKVLPYRSMHLTSCIHHLFRTTRPVPSAWPGRLRRTH